MKNKGNFYASNLIALMILSLTFVIAAKAQSNDIDNPTELTTKIVEGEGDGKAETVYYSFTATKGDVKVTVDAKTDDRSTPLRVALLDEDGKELLPIYVVAKGAGAREVAAKRFVRDTKVILKIRMDADKDVNLLTYKIKLDGAVKVAEPPAPETSNENAETTSTEPSEQTNPTPTPSQTTTDSSATEKKSKTKDKLKKNAKDAAKKTIKDIIDD